MHAVQIYKAGAASAALCVFEWHRGRTADIDQTGQGLQRFERISERDVPHGTIRSARGGVDVGCGVW